MTTGWPSLLAACGHSCLTHFAFLLEGEFWFWPKLICLKFKATQVQIRCSFLGPFALFWAIMGLLGWCVTLSKCFALVILSYWTSVAPQTGIIVLPVNKKKQISYKTTSILNVSCCFNRNWRTSKSQTRIMEGEVLGFFFICSFMSVARIIEMVWKRISIY